MRRSGCSGAWGDERAAMSGEAPVRVLVTGAGGFVGRSCLEALRSGEAHEIHATSRNASRWEGIVWHETDLLAPGAARRIIEEVKPRALLHLAWVATGDYRISPLNRDWERASRELFEAFARSGGERVVVAGSALEYGEPTGPCIEDQTPLSPRILYAEAKIRTGEALDAIASVAGMRWSWARLFQVYGPWEDCNRVIPAVARRLIEGRPADCTHSSYVRDFIHVKDVGEAIARVLETPADGAVNIGTGVGTTVRRILEELAEALGRRELLTFAAAAPGDEADSPALVADITRLKRVTGWTPRIGAAEGAALTAAWWRGREQSA
jgi:nucleoside-diphosphate-sugar epimerase